LPTSFACYLPAENPAANRYLDHTQGSSKRRTLGKRLQYLVHGFGTDFELAKIFAGPNQARQSVAYHNQASPTLNASGLHIVYIVPVPGLLHQKIFGTGVSGLGFCETKCGGTGMRDLRNEVASGEPSNM
jgi:hypothetical protein